MTRAMPPRTRRALERVRVAIDEALETDPASPLAIDMDPEDFGGPIVAIERGTRDKAEILADYRASKLLRGECRDCTKPAKLKRNGKPGRLCPDHAAADAARKAAIRR